MLKGVFSIPTFTVGIPTAMRVGTYLFGLHCFNRIFSFQCSSEIFHTKSFGYLAITQVHLDFLRRSRQENLSVHRSTRPYGGLVCRTSSDTQTSHQERWSKEYRRCAL